MSGNVLVEGSCERGSVYLGIGVAPHNRTQHVVPILQDVVSTGRVLLHSCSSGHDSCQHGLNDALRVCQVVCDVGSRDRESIAVAGSRDDNAVVSEAADRTRLERLLGWHLKSL